jgi:serine/threonine protein kinase
MVQCPTCSTQNPDSARFCRACSTPLDLQPGAGSVHSLPAGTRLSSGAYTLGKTLGQGGFGITYLGSDTRLKRPVAIKELFPSGCARHAGSVAPGGGWTIAMFIDAKQRFMEEGQTLARFSHVGIVRVYNAFEENSTAYIVMEYLRGKSLGGLLQERGGRLSEAEALKHIRAVGEALEVVHQAGLLHRDIKPDNAMVCEDGRVVLVDFGTAREYAAGKTHRHSVTLTPGYAPLEQYAQAARRGPFTDVYALAATLYHLLGGEPPMPATDRAAGVELKDLRQLNPKVSKRVADAVMAGLAMAVAERPPSVSAFLKLLAQTTGGTTSGSGRRKTQTDDLRTSAEIAEEKSTGSGSRRTPPQPSPPKPLPPKPPPPAVKPLNPVHLRRLSGHTDKVFAIAFSPARWSKPVIATGSADQTARIWDAETGAVLHTLARHDEWVMAVAFSPDGRLLASGSAKPGWWKVSGEVRIWDAATGTLVRTLSGHENRVYSLAFSPDGQTLASGSGIGGKSGEVILWNVSTGVQSLQLGGFSEPVMSVAFSPDGRLLATGSMDKSVKLWDIYKGTIEAAMPHGGHVYCVRFSPDGSLLATSCQDQTVQLWQPRTAVLKRCLKEHQGPVSAVAFTPDGEILASCGTDKTVKLWDVSTSRRLWNLTVHTEEVTSVAISPDGEMLASGSVDKDGEVWRLR